MGIILFQGREPKLTVSVSFTQRGRDICEHPCTTRAVIISLHENLQTTISRKEQNWIQKNYYFVFNVYSLFLQKEPPCDYLVPAEKQMQP